MTTDIVLTDAQIFDCFDRQSAEIVMNFAADELYPVGRAIEQAVLQSPEVQARQWQPIEAVPRDGTVIDLWHSEFGRFPGVYWGLPQHCCGEMGSLCDSEWHGLEPGWVDEFNEIPWAADCFTHWMPLPAPPPQ